MSLQGGNLSNEISVFMNFPSFKMGCAPSRPVLSNSAAVVSSMGGRNLNDGKSGNFWRSAAESGKEQLPDSDRTFLLHETVGITMIRILKVICIPVVICLFGSYSHADVCLLYTSDAADE